MPISVQEVICTVLTHLEWDKMPNILQTTLSNQFAWMNHAKLGRKNRRVLESENSTHSLH